MSVRNARGLGLLVAVATLLAAGAAVARSAAGELTAWQLLACRSVVFIALLAPWAVRNPTPARGVNRRLLLAQAFASVAFLWLYLFALTNIPLSLATILTGTTPPWSILLLWALDGLRPPGKELIALAVAVLGVVAIVHPEGEISYAAVSRVGMAAALVTAGVNAVVFVLLGRLATTDAPNTINLWLAIVALAVAAVPLSRSALPTSAGVWLAGAAYGLFALAGYTLLNYGMKNVSPTTGSLAGVLMPVIAAVLGWIFFGERLSMVEGGGMAAVLLSAYQVSRIESAR